MIFIFPFSLDLAAFYLGIYLNNKIISSVNILFPNHKYCFSPIFVSFHICGEFYSVSDLRLLYGPLCIINGKKLYSVLAFARQIAPLNSAIPGQGILLFLPINSG